MTRGGGRSAIVVSLLGASIVAAVAATPTLVSEEEIVALRRAEEAGQPDARLVELPPVSRARGDRGPIIKLVTPKAGETVSRHHVKIELRFEPRTAPVDPSTLRVLYRIIFTKYKDVTDLLRSMQGAKITGDGLTTPAFTIRATGEQRFRVKLSDQKHVENQEEFSIVLE